MSPDWIISDDDPRSLKPRRRVGEPRYTNIPYLSAVRRIVEAMRFVESCQVSTKEEMGVKYRPELIELAAALRSGSEAGMTSSELNVAAKWGRDDVEWVLANF